MLQLDDPFLLLVSYFINCNTNSKFHNTVKGFHIINCDGALERVELLVIGEGGICIALNVGNFCVSCVASNLEGRRRISCLPGLGQVPSFYLMFAPLTRM
jgi:hypothetical protein